MSTMTLDFKLLKIKVPFPVETRIMELMDKADDYCVHISDFDKEAHVIMFTLVGQKPDLTSFLKDFGHVKPVEYYML